MIEIAGQPQTSMDLLRIILRKEMRLKEDHLMIYDQKWVIPPFEDMYVVLEYRNAQPIANNNKFVPSPEFGNQPIEIQTVNMLEKIIVGVFSANDEAMYRKEEVLMAIMSSFSQLIQENYAFKIARVGSIEDLSYLEGAQILKRYDIELSIYAWYKKVIKSPYLEGPFNLQIIANDTGTGEIKQNVTVGSLPPN